MIRQQPSCVRLIRTFCQTRLQIRWLQQNLLLPGPSQRDPILPELGHPPHDPAGLAVVSSVYNASVRVRVERMGPGKFRNVGKSQWVLIMINPIISTRTRIDSARVSPPAPHPGTPY
jgi:hypothetical protein